MFIILQRNASLHKMMQYSIEMLDFQIISIKTKKKHVLTIFIGDNYEFLFKTKNKVDKIH